MGNWNNQSGIGRYNGYSSVGFSHNAKNQRTSSTDGLNAIHDLKGNMTLTLSSTAAAPGTPVSWALGMSYDQLNQLSSTRSYGDPVTSYFDRFYRYDALGRRYAKLNTTAANSDGTIYVTNPEFRNIAVMDNYGNTHWNTIWGKNFNEVIMVDGWGNYYYQHGDQIHSTIGVSKENGTIQSLVHYWPYGDFDQQIIQNDLGGYVAAATLYSGELYDYETRLSYYGYRYYNPSIGRWINRDPIGELGGVNLYEMVGGRVTHQLDLLGLKKICVSRYQKNLAMSGQSNFGEYYHKKRERFGFLTLTSLQGSFDITFNDSGWAGGASGFAMENVILALWSYSATAKVAGNILCVKTGNSCKATIADFGDGIQIDGPLNNGFEIVSSNLGDDMVKVDFYWTLAMYTSGTSPISVGGASPGLANGSVGFAKKSVAYGIWKCECIDAPSH